MGRPAPAGGTDWSQFTEVWQYGTNEAPEAQGGDPINKQDGVAPQVSAKDLPDNHRAYIPQDGLCCRTIASCGK